MSDWVPNTLWHQQFRHHMKPQDAPEEEGYEQARDGRSRVC